MVALVNHYESGTGAAVFNKRRCFWFAPVRAILGSPRNSPEFDDLLIFAQNPVLHLYGSLAKLHQSAGCSYF